METATLLIKAKYTLNCSVCNRSFDASQINTFATCDDCGKNPIVVNLALDPETPKSQIDDRERSMWRYHNFLPVADKQNIVTLGEGWTPMLKLKNLASRYNMDWLMMKDESLNPTGSFKARGLSMAVTKAKELGIETCIAPTAGNAGGALAAYCAAAGMKSVVVMPTHTPDVFKKECKAFGAELILIDGLISDCAKKVAEIKAVREVFDVSTMKEPYRLEGKKTLGYEIAEQLNWNLPDVILYPTGGGTGLIGIWKAFQEMAQMGWIEESKFPRMVAVQAENCMPVIDTFKGLQANASAYKGKPSIANGLAVPHPFAENMILDVLRSSNGTVVSVSETEITENLKEMARTEGLLVAPEGAALLGALKTLLQNGSVKHDEKVLLLNTGSAYKYMESFEF